MKIPSRGVRGFTALALALCAAPSVAQSDCNLSGYWETRGGVVTLELDESALRARGVKAGAWRSTARSRLRPHLDTSYRVEYGERSRLVFASNRGGFSSVISGSLRSVGTLVLQLPSGRELEVGDFELCLAMHHNGSHFSGSLCDRRSTDQEVFVLTARDARKLARFDGHGQRLEWAGIELRFSAPWAKAQGAPELAGVRAGWLHLEAPVGPATVFEPER
ncbi:MAG: hypothetical protein D6731_17540, partial [Planctomycetota bacterium]